MWIIEVKIPVTDVTGPVPQKTHVWRAMRPSKSLEPYRYACRGCNRPARVCWTRPCLHLETKLALGQSAVARWWQAAGFRVKVDGKAIRIEERIRR